MISEQKLAKAELAIEMLADVLGVSEREVVVFLADGIDSISPSPEYEKSKKYEYFIEEMEATFGI